MTRGGAPMQIGSILVASREARAAVARPMGEIMAFVCAVCRVAPVGVRPDVCAACARSARDPLHDDALDRARIPEHFRWADLGLRPFRPPWGTEPVVRQEDVDRAAAFRGSLIVIRGKSGAGKTSLACALLRRAVVTKNRSGVFVEAEKIAPDAHRQDIARELFDRATSESCVVIDGIGQDVGGAPGDSGIAAFRSRRMRELVREIHNDSPGHGTPKRRLIITADIEGDEFLAAYDEGLMRRVFEETDDTLIMDLSLRAQARPTTRLR